MTCGSIGLVECGGGRDLRPYQFLHAHSAAALANESAVPLSMLQEIGIVAILPGKEQLKSEDGGEYQSKERKLGGREGIRTPASSSRTTYILS